MKYWLPFYELGKAQDHPLYYWKDAPNGDKLIKEPKSGRVFLRKHVGHAVEIWENGKLIHEAYVSTAALIRVTVEFIKSLPDEDYEDYEYERLA